MTLLHLFTGIQWCLRNWVLQVFICSFLTGSIFLLPYLCLDSIIEVFCTSFFDTRTQEQVTKSTSPPFSWWNVRSCKIRWDSYTPQWVLHDLRLIIVAIWLLHLISIFFNERRCWNVTSGIKIHISERTCLVAHGCLSNRRTWEMCRTNREESPKLWENVTANWG